LIVLKVENVVLKKALACICKNKIYHKDYCYMVIDKIYIIVLFCLLYYTSDFILPHHTTPNQRLMKY